MNKIEKNMADYGYAGGSVDEIWWGIYPLQIYNFKKWQGGILTSPFAEPICGSTIYDNPSDFEPSDLLDRLFKIDNYQPRNNRYHGSACEPNYYYSRQWLIKRLHTMVYADFCCQKCGRPAQQCHHLNYNNRYREVEGDLMAVCNYCHMAIHGISF